MQGRHDNLLPVLSRWWLFHSIYNSVAIYPLLIPSHCNQSIGVIILFLPPIHWIVLISPTYTFDVHLNLTSMFHNIPSLAIHVTNCLVELMNHYVHRTFLYKCTNQISGQIVSTMNCPHHTWFYAVAVLYLVPTLTRTLEKSMPPNIRGSHFWTTTMNINITAMTIWVTPNVQNFPIAC